MALTDQMELIQTFVTATIGHLNSGDTSAARLEISKIRLVIATTPAEMRDEFAQIKMHDASSINEILNSLEEQIAEIEAGGTLEIQRIPINLGSSCDDDYDPYCL